MFKYINSLLHPQEKCGFDISNCEIMKLNNAINYLKEKIAYAKIKSKKNREIINKLRERLLYLYHEFYDTTYLIEDGKKNDISSVSVDTDCIIDKQNELKTMENKIQLLRNTISTCKHQICELRIQLALTNQKMKQNEKERAQLQILCVKAEIAFLQSQIQKGQERLFDKTKLQADLAILILVYKK
ncbi:Protein PAM1 [Dirofilaria immitis]